MPFWHVWHEFLHALVSPAAILAAAYFAWKKQRRIAIDRATIDFISKHEVANAQLREARALVARFAREQDHPRGLLTLLNPSGEEEFSQRLLISAMLNHYEMVAVAIRQGAFSEAIYKDWNRSTYVAAWTRLRRYVPPRRDQIEQQSAWENFEDLATRWAQEDAD